MVYSFLLLVILSVTLIGTAGGNSSTVSLAITADNTYEFYYNGVELTPQNFTSCSPASLTYPSRYCCLPVLLTDTNNQGPRCNWMYPEVYTVARPNGTTILAIKYINGFEGVAGPNYWDPFMDQPPWGLDYNCSIRNPSAYMVEFLDCNAPTISWVCTAGNNTAVIDVNGDRNWITPEFDDSSWIPALSQGYNVPGAWRYIQAANLDPAYPKCADAEGNSDYYNVLGRPVSAFDSLGNWFYNIFHGNSFAYCRGTIVFGLCDADVTHLTVSVSNDRSEIPQGQRALIDLEVNYHSEVNSEVEVICQLDYSNNLVYLENNGGCYLAGTSNFIECDFFNWVSDQFSTLARRPYGADVKFTFLLDQNAVVGDIINITATCYLPACIDDNVTQDCTTNIITVDQVIVTVSAATEVNTCCITPSCASEGTDFAIINGGKTVLGIERSDYSLYACPDQNGNLINVCDAVSRTT